MKHPFVFAILSLGFFAGTLPAQNRTVHEYALLLEDAPVARQVSSRSEMRSARALAAGTRIQRAQDAVRQRLAAMDVRVVTSTKTLLNAIFVQAEDSDVAALRALPGVKRVVKTRRFKLHLNKALPLVKVPEAWSALAATGISNPGAGVKIAIIDTGIDKDHPGLQDSSLSMPSGFPLCDPADCAAYTSNKVIVARSYVWMDAQGTFATSRPDDYSPRDHIGHGTALAVAAAGVSHAAPLATISGVAPKAYVGSYKVFGSPGINEFASESAVAAALEDAYNDGMDIANLSLGLPAWYGPNDTGAICGNSVGEICEMYSQAVETAISNGMLVVASAGNAGDDYAALKAPALSTVETPGTAPSALTVGGTVNGHQWLAAVGIADAGAPANVTSLAAMFGLGPAPPAPLTAPLHDVNGLGCQPLGAGTLTGAVALIQRGACLFADKVLNAEAAGAVGVIFYCDDSQYCSSGGEALFPPGGLESTAIPAALIGTTAGRALKAYTAAHPGAQVTMDASVHEFDDPDVDSIASFSSHGPSIAPESALKPEIVAPATGMYVATERYDANGAMYSPTGYAIVDGTSFSAPITSGVAALVKQAHPDFSPAQIKSAIVNTATSVEDGGLPASVAAVGAGKLNAQAAVTTNVTVEPATLPFGVVTAALIGTQKTLHIVNRSAHTVTLAVAQTDPDSAVHLQLSSTTVPAGQTRDVTVTLQGTVPAPGSYGGAVTVRGGAVDLRVPYHYLVGDGVPDNAIITTSPVFDGTVNYEEYTALRVIDRYGVSVVGAPVTWSTSGGAYIRYDPIQGMLEDTRTFQYGWAGAFSILGPLPYPPQIQEITADIGSGASALSVTFTALPRGKPTVNTNGVVNGASWVADNNGLAAAAPGSYISIFGANLSDIEANFDEHLPADYIYLPISLAGVSVGFDVPTAGLSVPGHLSWVGPNQLNVQVPWELQGQTAAFLKIRLGDSVSLPFAFRLADNAPGIFEFDLYGTGQVWAAAQHLPDYSPVGPSHPAQKGEWIVVYANGLGPVSNQPASGELSPFDPLARTVNLVSVTIGGVAVSEIDYAGLTPGCIGLYQINVRVPAGAPSGTQPVVVTVSGSSSKAANIAIQ